MVAFAEAAPATETGTSPTRAVLLEDALDPAPLKFGQQEVRREERIANEHANEETMLCGRRLRARH